MRRIPALFLPILLLAAPALAAVDPAKEYEACIALTRDHPRDALKSADDWARKNNGGVMAAHCKALAQMSLGEYEAAAKALSAIANDPKAKISVPTRARIYAQAAQAQLTRNQPDEANRLLSQAIDLQPAAPDYRIDRSIVAAMTGDYQAAVKDLDVVLAAKPDNVEALTFRASARRFLSQPDLANADVEKALQLQPDKPEALLERGALRAIAGNIEGAKADWERIIATAPTTQAARAAQDNLKILEQAQGN